MASKDARGLSSGPGLGGRGGEIPPRYSTQHIHQQCLATLVSHFRRYWPGVIGSPPHGYSSDKVAVIFKIFDTGTF
jgi:hypothetical protein